MSAHRHHPPKRFLPRTPVAYDGAMEARVAVLEQIAGDTRDALLRLEAKMDGLRDKQERDFRIVFGALITVAVGLAAVMAHGFRWF